MKKGLGFLLALFTCFMVVGCDNKKPATPVDPDNPIIDDGGNGNVDPGTEVDPEDEKIKTVEVKNGEYVVELKEQNESIRVNNLTLKFYGEDVSKETKTENSYRYVLTLSLGGKEINSNVFSNPTLRVINSDNLASKFSVYFVDDIYILKSSRGAQKEGEYGFAFDIDGNFIRSFEDASFQVDPKAKTVSMVNCLTTDPDEECFKGTFKIVNKDVKLES